MKGNSIKTETYGLKSQKTPPPINELAAFANNLIKLVKNIKFPTVQNQLQRTLKPDTKLIQQSSKTNVKKHLKIVSGIIKSRSTTLNIKIIRNYQKNLGKSKSAMEHQKLHGKLSENDPLTTEIATYKGDKFANKRIEIINTCRHRSKYKLANCEAID